jgi:hypothetical protein
VIDVSTCNFVRAKHDVELPRVEKFGSLMVGIAKVTLARVPFEQPPRGEKFARISAH